MRSGVLASRGGPEQSRMRTPYTGSSYIALPICSRRSYGESGSFAVAEGRYSWAS
jgi:hypothetical protein